MPRPFALLACLTLAAVPALGQPTLLRLEPSTTEVNFLVTATGHDVHGTLHLQRGEVRFDRATGAASGEIVLDARRAETGNRSRDETMRDKVLETVRFPSIAFRPSRVEGQVPEEGRGEISIVGVLSLHGEEHPLRLPVTVEAGPEGLTAHTVFAVPYVAWGLHNPSLFVLRVADTVEVTVDAVGRLEEAPDVRAAGGRR